MSLLSRGVHHISEFDSLYNQFHEFKIIFKNGNFHLNLLKKYLDGGILHFYKWNSIYNNIYNIQINLHHIDKFLLNSYKKDKTYIITFFITHELFQLLCDVNVIEFDFINMDGKSDNIKHKHPNIKGNINLKKLFNITESEVKLVSYTTI